MANKLNVLSSLSRAAITLLLGVPSAHAIPITYTATLSGTNENPPNASTGTGDATVTIDVDADTLEVEINFSGLTSTAIVAHIHCCVDAPGTVGIATPTPGFPGFPAGASSGSYLQTFDTTLAATFNPAFMLNNGGTEAGAEAALAVGLAAGQAYVDIHSTGFSGGDIRGFLQPAPAPEPEPESFTLLGIGLAGLIWARRQRNG